MSRTLVPCHWTLVRLSTLILIQHRSQIIVVSFVDPSGPSTPEDRYAVDLRIKLPGKRKIKDMDVNDTLSQKVSSVGLL
jgi:hypothetical protein